MTVSEISVLVAAKPRVPSAGVILTKKNKINENKWKIAETIYTPFQKVNFWPVLTVSCNFENEKKSEENSWNQLNNWQKSSLLVVKSSLQKCYGRQHFLIDDLSPGL